MIKPFLKTLLQYRTKTFHITVMRPFCLVESRSQDAATNAGVVYLTTNLYHQLFIDIEKENIYMMLKQIQAK